MIKKTIIFCLGMLLNLNVFSAEQILELKDIVKIAKENNPIFKKNAEKLNELDAQRSIVIGNLYPSASFSLNSSHQKDAVYTGNPKFGGNAYDLYSSDLKVTQSLYSYGSLSVIKSAELTNQIQELNNQIQERTVEQNIIESFYRFILNQRLMQNLTKVQEIIQKSLMTANERYKTGRGQLLDVLQVKTQLALISPQIDSTKNQFEIAANQLSYYMGDKDRPNLKIKGDLKTIYFKDLEKKINLKRALLPEYEINKTQIKQLEFNRDVISGKNYPTLKIVGDYLNTNYKKAELFSDYSRAWSIQLQLNVPLFSGFSSVYERSAITSQERQLFHVKKDLENSLSLVQMNSLKNVQTTEASLISAEAAAKLAEESQKEASKNYRLATIDFLQFLSVQQAALQAQNALDLLKFQSILAYSNYFIATGQPLSVLVDYLESEGK